MLNVTTIIDAKAVVAVINANITVVAACVRGVARKLKKRLDPGFFGKSFHHPWHTPSWYPAYQQKLMCVEGLSSGSECEQSCLRTTLLGVQ